MWGGGHHGLRARSNGFGTQGPNPIRSGKDLDREAGEKVEGECKSGPPCSTVPALKHLVIEGTHGQLLKDIFIGGQRGHCPP